MSKTLEGARPFITGRWLANGEGVAGCGLLIGNVVTGKEIGLPYPNDLYMCQHNGTTT